MTNETVILITGATGGIGAATARKLSASGFNLVLSGRRSAELAALADELSVTCFSANLTDESQTEELIARAFSVHGRLDGIVHAVGSILLKPAHATSLADFRTCVETNLTTSFLVLKHGTKKMMTTGGSLVFFSTVATGIGLANHEAVAAAKAGIDGLVISAAATYATHGIRVNAVAPGLTRTPLTSRITTNESALKASTAMHPLGRIGEPEDVASAAAWLVDPAQGWVTGQILRVDGGLSTVKAR